MFLVHAALAAAPGPDGGLDTISAKQAGLRKAELKALVREAESLHSSGLVVIKDGALVGSWVFDEDPGALLAMSVTKSIVSLAVGIALDDGAIESLDQPVYTWFPEWKQIGKEDITLRHLLNHTSGLRAHRTTEEIYASPDFVQLALAADLASDPGTQLFYNNKATNLLPELVSRAVGQPFEDFVRARLFEPLGITEWEWQSDPAGHAQGMAGLAIRPIDLAKIGAMLANDGRWADKTVVSAAWITTSTGHGNDLETAKKHGLLWWRLPREQIHYLVTDALEADWRASGVSEDFLAAVQPYKNKPLPDREAFFEAVTAIFANRPDGEDEWHKTTWGSGRRDGTTEVTSWAGFAGNGYLGQSLVVLPEEKLVVVRMIRPDRHTGKQDDFGGLESRVLELVPAPKAR